MYLVTLFNGDKEVDAYQGSWQDVEDAMYYDALPQDVIDSVNDATANMWGYSIGDQTEIWSQPYSIIVRKV